MRVVVVKSNYPSVNPQMQGEGKQRKDGSWEVTFASLRSTMPGKESQFTHNTTLWFPKEHIKEI